MHTEITSQPDLTLVTDAIQASGDVMPDPTSVAGAKSRLRQAVEFLPKHQTSADNIRQARRLAAQAIEQLDAALNAKALETKTKASKYNPDAIVTDCTGRRRSPAATPGYLAGRRPGNAGKRYPATPPTLPEIRKLLAAIDTSTDAGKRFYALVLIIWRAGLRISEALALQESDLNRDTGEVYVRCGKGGKSRMVGIDDWVWPMLQPWLDARAQYPLGPLFCTIAGPTAGTRSWAASGVRKALRELPAKAGVRKRVAPHQWRHAMTVELLGEEKSLIVIQRQLGHANLQSTNHYTQGFPQRNVIQTMRGRSMPAAPIFEAAA